MGRRRKRSVNPKFLLSEVNYFDDINTNADDDIDNFSFDEDSSDSERLSSAASMKSFDRIKRNAAVAQSNRELQFEPLKFDSSSDEESNIESAAGNKGRRKNKKKQQQSNGGSSKRKDEDNEDNKEPVLDKLVKDIKQKVKDSKKFWSHLPYQICNNEEIAAPSSSDANCWNGNSIDR